MAVETPVWDSCFNKQGICSKRRYDDEPCEARKKGVMCPFPASKEEWIRLNEHVGRGGVEIHDSKLITIAGPCAVESREHALETALEAKKRGIDIVRLNLWKPRTKPGFEGVGDEGITWLLDVAQMGLTPSTEVILPNQAEKLIDAVIKNSDSKVLIWLGSRNQNHLIQREIGRVIAGEERTMLMIKNQPWSDEDHWKGIAEHVLSGGADESQLLMCHRGFKPGAINPDNLRNMPDFEMAIRVKRETGLPMIIDPSHMGGTRNNVIEIARQAMNYRKTGLGFDGLIVEVHPDPDNALTDAKQQLTWGQFDRMQENLKYKIIR